jgi:hypothetical protein
MMHAIVSKRSQTWAILFATSFEVACDRLPMFVLYE